MTTQLFQILLLVIQILMGIVMSLAWYIIRQQNRRLEMLDQCVDRRFEALGGRRETMIAQLASLPEGYAQVTTTIQVLRAESTRRHEENQEIMGNIAQKVDGLLLEELRDLRQQRRGRLDAP